MATFVFTYRAPQDYMRTPETRAAWMAWFDSMGSALAEIGKPVAEARVLGEAGAGTQLGGYSFVTAEDFEAAVTIAKGCPFLDGRGGIEVGEVTEAA